MKRIFIGSSTESLPIARVVQAELKSYKNPENGERKYNPVLWNQDTIPPSSYTVPGLIEYLSKSDAAVFIFSDDDKVTSRGKKSAAPRDNVVFESGLAIGMLGQHHCFILKSKKAKRPSDYDGLTVIDYDISVQESEGRADLRAEMSEGARQIDDALSAEAEADIPMMVHSWLDYMDCITKLYDKISKSPRTGGFRFDVIVGIARGGIIAADIIKRKCASTVPLLCIAPEYSDNGNPVYDMDRNSNLKSVVQILNEYQNILIVDDISRTGQTLPDAKTFLVDNLPGKTIKSAAAYVSEKLKNKIDYYGKTAEQTINMPYSYI